MLDWANCGTRSWIEKRSSVKVAACVLSGRSKSYLTCPLGKISIANGQVSFQKDSFIAAPSDSSGEGRRKEAANETIVLTRIAKMAKLVKLVKMARSKEQGATGDLTLPERNSHSLPAHLPSSRPLLFPFSFPLPQSSLTHSLHSLLQLAVALARHATTTSDIASFHFNGQLLRLHRLIVFHGLPTIFAPATSLPSPLVTTVFECPPVELFLPNEYCRLVRSCDSELDLIRHGDRLSIWNRCSGEYLKVFLLLSDLSCPGFSLLRSWWQALGAIRRSVTESLANRCGLVDRVWLIESTSTFFADQCCGCYTLLRKSEWGVFTLSVVLF